MRRVPMQVLAVLTAAVLSTACGSTSPSGSGPAGGSGSDPAGPAASSSAFPAADAPAGSALGGPSGGVPGATRPGSGSPGSVSEGPATAGGTAPGRAGGGSAEPADAPGGSSGSTRPATSANGPGITATTIALGIPFSNDADEANTALGAGGENPGDTRDYYRAALADVNDRGGVLGRKLVANFHEVSASDNIDVAAQAACERWTQDNKVFAMFFRGQIAYECARRAGILVSDAGSSTGPVYARYPNLIDPSSIRLERLGAVTVKAMLRAGWHKPEPKWPTGKIGLVTWDHSDYRYAMTHGYLKALHEAGLKETDVRYVAVPQSDTSIADASAAISSAVLRFAEQRIDHVFISDGPAGIFLGTGLTLLFLNNAKSQRYYPRYGFNTNNSPGWENLPADQQVGMLAIDSSASEAQNDAGIAPNAQRERCWSLMRKRGLRVGDTNTGNIAIGACDTAWYIEAVLKNARGTLLPDVIAAAESLGTSYRSPWTYGTRLSSTQHDGAALFRTSRFDDSCACMRYTSKPYEP